MDDSTWAGSTPSRGGPEIGVFFCLLPPLPLFALLLNVFAAFWAAEIIDEKKPLFVGGGPFSGVGVKGASVKLESLLGPMLFPEPDLMRRCDLELPDGDTVMLGMVGRSVLPARPLDPWRACVRPGGVGGVLTMAGAAWSPEGGVRGGAGISPGVLPFRLDGLSEEATSGSLGLKGAKGVVLEGSAATSTSASASWVVESEWSDFWLFTLGLALGLRLARKTPLNLSAGDLERPVDWFDGGSKAVLLVDSRRGAESVVLSPRLSDEMATE